MATFTYAEIAQNNIVSSVGTAPFMPENVIGFPFYVIDITGLDPQPQGGWLYDPETQTFREPEPEKDPYLGELVLDLDSKFAISPEVELTDGLSSTYAPNSNLDLTIGERVTVTGKIEKDGQLIPIDFDRLRIPILPTDLEGNPLPAMQPSMAVAKIEAGLVTATWIPEFTGTYAITERGLNVRLPKGFWLRFKGLLIFVLPQETT